MKISELRTQMGESTRENLEAALALVYKTLPKAKKEEIDEDLSGVLRGETQKKPAKKEKTVDVGEMFPEIDQFLTYVDDGLYVTPKAALDVVTANPPLTGFAKFLSVHALGIQFRRHKSANMTKLIATWRDSSNDHVYEISVQRDGDSPNCGWRALATNDGHNVFQLRTKNRTNCEHFALSAMKRYLKCGHRKTYRTLAKKEGK